MEHADADALAPGQRRHVLITGAGGQLGVALADAFADDDVAALTRGDWDVRHPAPATVRRPDVVLHAAAWTDVDGAEDDPQGAAEVNVSGTSHAAELGAPLVAFSTDYVFDGRKPEGFYTQRDDPHPASAYGAAKLEGERRGQMASARTSVVRTGWVFGPLGRNFLSTAAARARRGERMKAISDSFGTPTYAPDLAARLRELAELDLPGVYHVVNAGEGTSFEGFAREAAQAVGDPGAEIEGVLMDTLKRPAPRPRNSRLRCLVSEAIGLRPLRDWRDALAEFAGIEQ
jgi:dTDP-4-dehydrorhamnose reductase